MNLCIFGTGYFGGRLLEIAQTCPNPNATFTCFCDNFTHGGIGPGDLPILTVEQAIVQVRSGKLDGICIPEKLNWLIRIQMINQLLCAGIQAIYVAPLEVFSSCCTTSIIVYRWPFDSLGEKSQLVGKYALYIDDMDDPVGPYLKHLLETLYEGLEIICFALLYPAKVYFSHVAISGLPVQSIKKVQEDIDLGLLDGLIVQPCTKQQDVIDLEFALKSFSPFSVCQLSTNVVNKTLLSSTDVKNLVFRPQHYQTVGKLCITMTLHCNLNCQGCAGFFSLNSKEMFYPFPRFKEDLKRIKDFFGDELRYIEFTGGESLLHPQILDFITYVRQLYPHIQLMLITNGLLLPDMPAAFFDVLKEEQMLLTITDYPLEETYRTKLRNLLARYKINTHFIPRNEFKKSLKMVDEISQSAESTFELCPTKLDHVMFDGYITRCCQGMTRHFFNSAFAKDFPLPKDAKISLHDYDDSHVSLSAALMQPDELCAFCVKQDNDAYPWLPITDTAPADIKYWLQEN